MSRLMKSEAGATAAEFALILPAALLLFFGIIDTGRYMWDVNRIEKAAQIGARVAVTTDTIEGGLDDADFSGACGGLNVGDRIECADAMSPVTCTSEACDSPGGCSPFACEPENFRPEAFNRILTSVQQQAPFVGPENLRVTYSAAGIGYYGDPACFGDRDKDGICLTGELPDIAPLTTITILSPPFRPSLAPFAFLRLPTRSYSLTLEDGRGTVSY